MNERIALQQHRTANASSDPKCAKDSFTFLVILASFALCALPPMAALGQGVECKNTTPSTVYDINHPKSWVRISEYSKRQDIHTILQPGFRAETGGDYSEKVFAEVDVDSRILVEFSRECMQVNLNNVEVALQITAVVRGDKEVRRIEVPGYSLVGEKAEQATARIRAASENLALINQAGSILRQVGDTARVRQQSTVAAAQQILEAEPTLRALLKVLADAEWDDVSKGIAHLAGFNAIAIQQEAKRALIALDSLMTLAGDDAEVKRRRFVTFIGRGLEPLRLLAQRSDPDIMKRNLAAYFIGALKDTDISVPLSGAKPGEDIVITFTNFAEDNAKRRSLTVRLGVRRFGWTQQVADASLLVKRLGATAGGFAKRIASARAIADTATRPTSARLQEPVQFVPAPGVTLGWSYLDRGEDRRGKIIRFFEPGAGITVLFPKFQETTVRFTPPLKTDDKVVEEQTHSDKLDVAVGLTFSLFGNQVVATFGRNLTSTRPRNYWGIGFSFAKIASTLAGGEKEK